jgi:hypothetical protein
MRWSFILVGADVRGVAVPTGRLELITLYCGVLCKAVIYILLYISYRSQYKTILIILILINFKQ